MISRYQIKEINQIWSDENKYNTWLKVEQLVCQAWAKLGYINKQDILKINNNLKVDLNRMLEIEQETKHDVVAFTRMLSEQLDSESKWIHLGITSTDIVDTAQNYLIKQSNQIVDNELKNISDTLKKLAFEHKNTLIMGRTHGMYGEPTSLGLKFALWFDEFQRHIKRFSLAKSDIQVVKISGSMGNYANLEPIIEEYVANKLDMNVDSLSTQVCQRDRHIFLVEVLANIASTLEKISTEIRLLQRSDVNELAEGFFKNQKGSSSMPHKKNPISSENVAGLSRYIKSIVNIVLENNNLWHERDISHSSNERIYLPDIFNLIIYILKRMNETLTNLVINQSQMLNHIKQAKNIYFSQRVLTFILLNYKNVTREKIYDLIQQITFKCFKDQSDFKDEVLKSSLTEYVSIQQLEELFDDQFFLRHIDYIFNRVFNN
ncbi:adenylosuccinate lyase [Mycoplasma capricolum]|uniref:Adenylosuccinate lyase n=1 Tax=Mycoplasma capricolum subsp. capripneumoniae 87001 TaxID=1124992 RepID=A0A9N7AYK5_MYCCC|nr:adenylosuccinate lyase [Mycoplasma capricolum]AJK51794.1 adenylosuccinate lyase [Mycoplasma capricolum subsp. capripneumoniae 87001]AOQ22398.1 adenylosuccinate lyase [Mycoplasma capricolum subsp. capripneumoniae M1601]KEY84745.1 Adenylosuccinate lyase [Mycoplasma capricolum subsp. capripneumoniae 99108]WGD33365.1 Adenylosuccinate lyase [Mycoplasma capricolum subsp. capripneumoniae]CDZ18653.1 Adenylosuccinate lyase [Mycoplasma capricolum subsp. capripneumoniae]